MSNSLDAKYQQLLQDILDFGVEKQTRNGGTKSIFGYTISHKMSWGFPLLTTKKMFFKGIVSELLWFLRGDTNVKWLLEQNNNIWTGDAYKKYCNAYPDAEKTFQYEGSTIDVRKMTKEEFINQIKTDDEFAGVYGELGPIYGKQWRRWRKAIINPETGYQDFIYVDQIKNLINDLKTNPDSRRLMVNAWNVGELDEMVLAPCHYGFQVYTRELVESERYGLLLKSGYDGKEINTSNMMRVCDEKNIPTRAISLMWNQRSVDTFLGLPFNIASYGLLLEIIAKEVNMVPDELIGSLGDVHLYLNHIEQAKEQIDRESFDLLPKLIINDEFWNPDSSIINQINYINPDDFIIDKYQSHPSIKAPLSN